MPQKNIFLARRKFLVPILFALIVLVDISSSKPLVSITSTETLELKGIVTVNWDAVLTATVGEPWVGIFKMRSPDTEPIFKVSTGGKLTGSFSTPISEADFYEARYFQTLNGANILTAIGNRITVGTKKVQITLTPFI